MITKEWLEKAQKVSIEEIPHFINELMKSVEWKIDDEGYANIINVIYIGMMATFYAINHTKQGSISGFQASYLAWLLFKELMGFEEGTPLKLINYQKMLYPQSKDDFTTIDKKTFEWLQNQAKELLKGKHYSASFDYVAHLLNIIDGKVPFGYTLKEEPKEKQANEIKIEEFENKNVIIEFNDGNKTRGFIGYVFTDGIAISYFDPKTYYLIPFERIKSIKIDEGEKDGKNG